MKIESKFAGMHKGFLARKHSKMYVELLSKGELNDYLDKIGLQAKELMETIIDQNKAEIEKIEDPEKRLARLGQIELMAEEIAVHDIVFAPLA